METSIPIYNLYYLLCYAWDRLEERDLIDVTSSAPPRDTLNLLGRVLGSGLRALIRRGFERGYQERTEEIPGILGRISIASTIRRQLPHYGRAECVFDELEYDTPANRVLLWTLTTLARSPAVDPDLRQELAGLRRHLRDVRLVFSTVADCHRVTIHRNNRHYGFLIDICAIVLGMVLPDESGQAIRFRDFARDHQAMARLFEDFVRQFYIHHASECGVLDVSSRQIPWAGEPADEQSGRLWPAMKSDICIRRPTTPLVIDCKFYHSALKTSQYGEERLSSSNLYQVFTYVQNLSAVPGWENSEGLLLYAQNGAALDISHSVCAKRLRAATVDLNRPWPEIHSRLLQLVSPWVRSGVIGDT